MAGYGRGRNCATPGISFDKQEQHGNTSRSQHHVHQHKPHSKITPEDVLGKRDVSERARIEARFRRRVPHLEKTTQKIKDGTPQRDAAQSDGAMSHEVIEVFVYRRAQDKNT